MHPYLATPPQRDEPRSFLARFSIFCDRARTQRAAANPTNHLGGRENGRNEKSPAGIEDNRHFFLNLREIRLTDILLPRWRRGPKNSVRLDPRCLYIGHSPNMDTLT